MVDRLVNSEANARRIAHIESCFGMSGESLAIAGRVLVGEGILTKRCRKKLKPRQVFLFNDILVYGSIIINKKKYNRQHIIPLENVKLENISDDCDLSNGWLMKTPTKSFAVYAATPTEKVEWMAHIEKCVQELIKRTGNKPASEHAAVWVPDSASQICMHCNKTHFTVINRRHHCRNCGDVVCGACSKNKFLLPTMATKPVRVCNTCFQNLAKKRINCEQMNRAEQTFDGNTNTAPALNAYDMSKCSQINESSESDDDDSGKAKGRSDDDLARSVEDLSLDEKPTFYSSFEPTARNSN